MTSPISSTRNPRVQAAAKLHRRRHRAETGRTLIEGPHALSAAVEAGWEIVDVFRSTTDVATASLVARHRLESVAVTDEVLARVADTTHPRGPVAVVEPSAGSLRGGRTVVLVGVGDPGNVGTIIRTAAAFRFEVLAVGTTADVWSPKVLRAGAGGHFLTQVVRGGDDWLSLLRSLGVRIVATVAEGGAPPRPAGDAMALLIGDESAGLDDAVVAAADELWTLPMPGGTESLNAGVAASIAMYAAAQ